MKVKLFDISWDLQSINSFHVIFLDNIVNNTQISVGYLNLHGIYLYYKNKSVQEYLDSAAIEIDGMPIIWLLKLRGYAINAGLRITWVDWMYPLMSFCKENNLKVFYLGGKPGVAAKAMLSINDRIDGLMYLVNDGYFDIDSYENVEIVNKINSFGAMVLIVGMGMGRQEQWVLQNRNKLNANVILTCGAAAEYFAGEASCPPRWMGKIGLEWLFRLVEHPKRFWYRYLIEPWFILSLFFIRPTRTTSSVKHKNE